MNAPRLLMIAGGLLFFLGLVWTLVGKYLPFGRLPGDITYTKGSFFFAFPLGTSILLSLVLTLLIWLLRGLGK